MTASKMVLALAVCPALLSVCTAWDGSYKTIVADSANGGVNEAGVGGNSYYGGEGGDGTVENSIVKQSANGGNIDVDNGRHLLWPTETTVKNSANGGVNEAGVGGNSDYGGEGGDGTVDNSIVKQSANGGKVAVDNYGRRLLWPTTTVVKDSANGGDNLAGVGGDSYYGKAGDGTVQDSIVKQSANGGDVDVDNGDATCNAPGTNSANGGDNLAGVGGDSYYGKAGDGTVKDSVVKQSANGGNVDVDNGRHLLWPTETVVKNSANGGDNLAGVGGDAYYGKAGDGTVKDSVVKQSANGGNVDVDNGRHLLWPTETVVKNSANGGDNLAGVGGDAYYGKAGDGTVDNSIVKQSADGGKVDVEG